MIKVLIVEDEIVIARFIEQQLKANFPCSTMIALSPDDAHKKMQAFIPELILCDINLKHGISGIDLITALRENYRFEVIYITSYHDRSIVEKATHTNPANYLVKPIDEGQLLAGIQLVMHKLNNTAQKTAVKSKLEDLLTPTEINIVKMIGDKKSTQEIAQLLFASPATIKNKRNAICRKLDLPHKNNALLEWAIHHRNELG